MTEPTGGIPAASPQVSACSSGPDIEFRATDVPSRGRTGELLADGERAEQLGALDRAIESFGEAARSDDPALAATALTRLADVLRSRADWDNAIAAARKAQRTAHSIGEASGQLLETHAIIAEGNVFMCRGDFPEAKELFERVLTLTPDHRMRGLALQNIGSILAQQGQLGAAERAFSESYGYFQRAEYRRGEATALNNYGRVALDRGNFAAAESILEQAVAVAREVEHGELIALTMLNLAEAKARQGELNQAHDLASASLGSFNSSGNTWREIECLRLIGVIDEQRGDLAGAAACFERGLRLAQQIGALVETRTLGETLERLRRRT
jgi:tetratricopeptide (TPR) repeat protein